MIRRTLKLVTLGCLLAVAGAASASAQCLLMNPSFEVAGSAGATFGGWNQFGSVGSSVTLAHGAVAARVSGPNSGGFDVSGYWQNLDTAPGQRWTASVVVWHENSNRLQGQSRALLNIEWRDVNGNLISYESHTAADPATPTGQPRVFTVTSQAAPAGTVSTHFLVGVLQGPTDPQPVVYFDQTAFGRATPPTLDDYQWVDFPGGRTLDFSGYRWRVKGPGFYGPGPNLFSDGASHTWVDANGRLHLTVRNVSGSWYSTEVTLEQPLGYGDYVFTTRGRLDTLHPNVVLGLFFWQYGPCYDPGYLWWNPYDEIDVEFSRWGIPGNSVGQFVAQPYDWPGNLNRFNATFAVDELTSHAFRWLPNRVEFRSWRGGPTAESGATLIHSWTYTGPHIPRPDQPRVHLNLWQFNAPPSSNQEAVIEQFTFVQSCTGPLCGGNASGIPERPEIGALSRARPNPFDRTTTIAFRLPEDGALELTVHDVAGRAVRRLVTGVRSAGPHEIQWDGRDDAGRALPSGVYFYRIRGPRMSEVQRVVLSR